MRRKIPESKKKIEIISSPTLNLVDSSHPDDEDDSNWRTGITITAVKRQKNLK